MLIPKNYVLSNEIAKNSKIHIANFSMFCKDIENRNIKGTVLKYGGCTFINTKSNYLPKYFYKAIHSGNLTDLENCILLTYMKSELQCSKKDILNIPGVTLFVVSGKTFVKFTEKFVNQIKNKVITNISKKDFDSMDIDGVMLSKNNYMVWY